MTAARCPQCATAGTPEGRPGCSCRAGIRTEVQEFQPLRVRPYMGPREPADGAAGFRGDVPSSPPVAHRPGPQRPTGLRIDPPAPDWVDARVRQAPPTQAETADLGVLTPSSGPIDPGRTERWDGERARRGWLVPALVAGGAALAVTGAALGIPWVGGDDRALPDEVSATRDAIVPTAGGPATATSSASPSPSSSSASASATASPSAPVSPSAPPAPVPPPTRAAGTVAATPKAPPAAPQGVLREGDRGPAVVELQQRLNQIMDPDLSVNGVYDSRVRQYVAFYQSHFGISGDQGGVYGPDTRRHLESRTREP